METHDEKNELLAALALDALNEVEAQELAAQIADDAELAAELEEWRDIAANLALTAPAAEPSPAVRDNILAAIKKTPQTGGAPAGNGTPVVEKVSTIEQPKKSNVIQFPARPQRSTWNVVSTIGAIAASIVAVLLGISLFSANQTNRFRIEALTTKLENAERQLNETQATLERERQDKGIVGSPSSFNYELTGTKEVPTAKARLVFDAEGKAFLFVEGLPAAPQGKAYQIWWITDPTKPAPGGTFKTGNNGRGELRDQIPAQYTKAAVFAVTLEPEGGSQAPTSPVVLINNPT